MEKKEIFFSDFLEKKEDVQWQQIILSLLIL